MKGYILQISLKVLPIKRKKKKIIKNSTCLCKKSIKNDKKM